VSPDAHPRHATIAMALSAVFRPPMVDELQLCICGFVDVPRTGIEHSSTTRLHDGMEPDYRVSTNSQPQIVSGSTRNRIGIA
jgi:hypothetical protein